MIKCEYFTKDLRQKEKRHRACSKTHEHKVTSSSRKKLHIIIARRGTAARGGWLYMRNCLIGTATALNPLASVLHTLSVRCGAVQERLRALLRTRPNTFNYSLFSLRCKYNRKVCIVRCSSASIYRSGKKQTTNTSRRNKGRLNLLPFCPQTFTKVLFIIIIRFVVHLTCSTQTRSNVGLYLYPREILSNNSSAAKYYYELSGIEFWKHSTQIRKL